MKAIFCKLSQASQLFIIFFCVALLMAAYKALEEIFFKGSLTPWDSQIFTIIAAAGFATATAFFIRRSTGGNNDLLHTVSTTIFESQEGIMVTDANMIILRVNPSFTRITGYTAGEIVGRTPNTLNSGRQTADFYTAMHKNLESMGSWEGEIWNRRKSGEIYPEYLRITAVKNRGGKIINYVGMFSDITGIKENETRTRYHAFYDPLTLLPNRGLLMDRLQRALTSCTRTGLNGALLFIELDNFKKINDTLNYHIGDLLLQRVAERLESCVREGDTVARLGGDEFVVMLEGLSEDTFQAAEQAEDIGNKILTFLKPAYQLATHECQITASIGVSIISDHCQSREELLKQTETAMYKAKDAGRNTLRFFDPKIQTRNAIARQA